MLAVARIAMRPLFVCVLLTALVRVGHAAQDAQRPADVFRGRVDLITLDVSALDSKGKPVMVMGLSPCPYRWYRRGPNRSIARRQSARYIGAPP